MDELSLSLRCVDALAHARSAVADCRRICLESKEARERSRKLRRLYVADCVREGQSADIAEVDIAQIVLKAFHKAGLAAALLEPPKETAIRV